MSSVVITGVSPGGIGAACALLFAKNGFDVYGSVRKLEDAADLQRSIGSTFRPLVFDVTDTAAVQAAAASVGRHLKSQGRTLSALINNAGVSIAPHPLIHMPLELARRQLEVNVIAQLAVLQAFAPLLGTDGRHTGPPGRIISNSSVYGSYALPFMGMYCSSKSAIEGMCNALRLEMRVHGIRVIVVRPGPVHTPIWQKAAGAGSGEVTGDWAAYDDTSFRDALHSCKAAFAKFRTQHKHWLQPETVAETFFKAATVSRPKTHYVVTANWLENWLLPNLLPQRMIDGNICKLFGIRRMRHANGQPKLD